MNRYGWLMVSCWVFVRVVQAAPVAEPEPLFGRGELMIARADQVAQPALTLSADYQVAVTGMLARVTVTQRFQNPSNDWVEGRYEFPLPEDAAVDHMTLHIGERVIEGEIQPKAVAQASYQAARDNGLRASLVSQQRPNLFTNQVANIGPQESVVVRIEYQQSIRYHDQQFELRIPTAITPRYNGVTGQLNQEVSFAKGGWVQGNSPVNMASFVLDDQAPKVNPLTLRAHLQTGFALATLDSPYHSIRTHNLSLGEAVVELDKVNHADRDFVLHWSAAPDESPQAALFSQHHGDSDYHLIMMLPAVDQSPSRVARELILIIDTSGSMYGDSIVQAKASAKTAIAQLTAQDHFNIIEFNDRARPLFDAAQSVNPETIGKANAFIEQLQADGGTEMAGALDLALQPGTVAQGVRQIVFMTDGAVSNESMLFNMLEQRLGDSRLFTVGIGSAPNSYFMRKAAKFGRGTYTFIGSTGEVADKMQQLLGKLDSAVMTHLSVSWSSPDVESWPKHIPDLYADEPLLIVAKSSSPELQATLTGLRQQTRWQATLAVNNGQSSDGIAVRWARDKIEALTDLLHSDHADRQALEKAITAIALQQHLVSDFTSLVAVDKTPARPLSSPLDKQAVAQNLPHGTSARGFAMPSTATDGPFWVLLMLQSLLLCMGVRSWPSRRFAQ